MSLRLLQLSDCHLSAEPHKAYRGQSADRNLARFAEAVRAFSPDQLMLTGDLSEDGSSESYRRLIDWAQQFELPVAWLPGNHDDRSVMQPIMDHAGFEPGPILELHGWQLVLLDSAWPGRPDGELDAARLKPLARLDPDQPIAVFVHHHPVPVSVWIDRVPLRQPERLWQALAGHRGLKFVAFGHVHQRFRRRMEPAQDQSIECLAAPSTAVNSLPDVERFTPGPCGPMARWFLLEPNGCYRSGLLSLPRASSR